MTTLNDECLTMTGLLVSVRSAEEARLALAGGAAVIDVKEPNLGSLGRASCEVLQEIAAAIGDRVPLSAALGELSHFDPRVSIAAALPSWLPREYQYAKVGLAGMAQHHHWPERWRIACEALPASTSPVGVVYADWQTCGAPSPKQVFDAAKEIGCAALLIDTFDKSSGNLFAHLQWTSLVGFADRIRRAGLLLVLAGSLDLPDFPQALKLSPDLLAVRGAVCHGDRSGPLDVQKVAIAASAVAVGVKR